MKPTSEYTCPMHPEVVSDVPGNCPKCGMKLVPKETTPTARHTEHFHAIHDHNAGMKGSPVPHAHQHDHASGHDHSHMISDFRKRFFIVLALTIPILLLSPMIQHWLGLHLIIPGSAYLLVALSSVVYLYGGWPFLIGLVAEVRSRNPGMMFLIGFAITIAYCYSVAVALGLQGMDFFWELSTLILIMLLGHWIEMKSIAGASRELELLVKLLPADAHQVHGDHIMEVKTDTLKAGDIILVRPGEKVAADGIIRDGNTALNESLLTGESKPVEKSVGEVVIAGSMNGNGAIRVEVSHATQDSYLAQVIQLVRNAQNSKSKTQLIANQAARWLTVIAILAGIITFVVWYSAGNGLAFAMERMVTVIVICCPHALGLAVPLVVANSTTLAAKHGLLIKNRTAFENARKITTLVFDKTGTLTVGKFQVIKVSSLNNDYTQNDILQLAASLEQNSEHPIATGILDQAKTLNLEPSTTQNFKAITGTGIEATVNGKFIQVVSPGFLREQKIDIRDPSAIPEASTTVFVLADHVLIGFISLGDQIRPESREAIDMLSRERIKSILLTGDSKAVAESVSKQLGIKQYFAEVLPHQKLEKIKELQRQGEFVAMTGDGVNDAPALAQADIGMAVGSGSDIAAETAGIVLVNSNPKDVVNLILFGKATYRKMLQNLAWATGYNIIALPLAAGILYKQGIILSPAAGAVLMTISTIVVAINASTLKVRR